MKILFCKWGSICESGMDCALQELGMEVAYFTRELKHTDYDVEYMKGIGAKLDGERFDCVFSVNFVPIISKVCNLYHKMYVCWTVDHPSLQLYSKDLGNACNRVFMFDRMQYEKYYPVNPDRIFYMPLGCDPDLLHSADVTEEERERYGCDISFIGSTYSEKCLYNGIGHLPDYLRGFAEGVIRAQMNVQGYNLIRDSLTDEFCREFQKHADWGRLPEDYVEDAKGLIADRYLGEKCTEMERIMTLRNISEHFEMDMYTASDISGIPGIHNRGIADSVTMMPKIFQCSKINLNMTNRPISSGIPQRVYDIMGAGGFLLSNYQPEIAEYFEIGKELAVYESQSDLLEKIAYYLAHEEERREIAANGRRAIEEGHQYAMRLELMFEMALQGA